VDHIFPVDLTHVEELAQAEREQRRYSTLDLCRYDTFTLIVNSNQANIKRSAELINIAQKRGQLTIPLRVLHLGVDFNIVFADKAKDWIEKFQLGDEQCGGVLVRPDQHILALLDSDTTPQQLLEMLEEAMGW
jgi:hypothetical protein